MSRYLNGSLEERCTTKYIYVHIFCRSSRDLTFSDKILQGVRGDKWQHKNFDLEISFCFSLPISSFQRATAVSYKNNFHLRWRRVLSFEAVYFQKFVIHLFNTLKSIKKRLYIQKYNWKNLSVISLQFEVSFLICRDHYRLKISK